MKYEKRILTIILMLILLFKPYFILSIPQDSFRTISFEDKGYLIQYEIVQGENLKDMFGDLGFDIDGLFTGSQFNILVKNRLLQNRDIYFIESDSFEEIEVPVYTYENYIEVAEPLTASIETDGDLLSNLIGFNYYPVEQKTIEVEVPDTSTIYLPKIFTNISRPNFGSLLSNINYFDFLPFIIDNDFNRYEAEFTSLILNESFNVNIYNQGFDEFTVSLDMDLNPPIKMKVTWSKITGLLLSLSLHFIFEKRSSVFIISLIDYREIQSPVESPFNSYFISNSSANYDVIYEDPSTEDRLSEWKLWFDQLNQTQGLRYQYLGSGIDFETHLSVYDQSTETYRHSTPIHTSWISLIPPAVIPIWESYIGGVVLLKSLWEQLEEEINGFAFFLSGVTTTRYTIHSADLHIEHQNNDGLNQLLWYAHLHYISNNTRKVIPSYAVTDITFETEGWLAYSSSGMLEGFSFFYKEIYYSYLQDIDGMSILETFDNYYYDYFVESKPSNMTEPYFTETGESSYPLTILQIIFYSTIAYCYMKKQRKKREFNEK
ncbi:hypothetical protein EU534_02545 [Candidatus Heimdallarchaeota archaeon]|nr:MAG: hypothetical protein EU534_02545 [Candidatus Heimdallarchaeota archaeon]